MTRIKINSTAPTSADHVPYSPEAARAASVGIKEQPAAPLRKVRLTPAEKAHAEKHCQSDEIKARCAGELRVLKMVCELAVEQGYCVSLQDGEEWVLQRSTDVHALVMAAQTTDMDRLRIRKVDDVGTSLGTILFVYGNSPCEVIADYHTSLEEFLKPVTAYCDSLA